MASPTAPTPPTLPPPPVAPRRPEPPRVDPSVVQLGQLVTVLAQHPQYREKVLGLLHEAAPDVPIPELDIRRETQAKVDASAKTLREENAVLAKRLESLETSTAQRRWQEENGVTDEEYNEVVAMAKDKRIGDPDVALDYWRKSDPVLGRPRGTAGSSATGLTEESKKALYKNPKEWYEREANKVLTESRRRRGA